MEEEDYQGQERVFCPYFERMGVCLEPRACHLIHTRVNPKKLENQMVD